MDRLDEALYAYEEAIAMHPENVVAMIGRAETLKEMGRLEEALWAYDHIISLYPENIVARNGRAETLKEMGRLEEALGAYAESIALHPEDAIARTGRAETLRKIGQQERDFSIINGDEANVKEPQEQAHEDTVVAHIRAAQRKAKDPFRICGTVLNDKYELIEFAGSGGMGAVYRALNLIDRNIVAVKVLQPHIVTRSPEYAELFEREAKNAQGLDQPHIVKVFDSGKDEDLSYMVMEWVEGRSVEDVLTQGQLPLDRLTNIFEQICSAVAFAHERSIIHLDLKPGNILLLDRPEPDDFVKVIDFGLSRVISKESGTTVTKFRGTHQFCAPEQFGGKVSHRSDIYSLGATLYYLLTGVIPFGTSYINAKIHPNLALPEIPSVVRQRNLPPALDAVIRKALNKNPASRQQSALQLFDEFCSAIRRADAADNIDNLFIKLKEILVDELQVDESEVVPTARIIDDLGADEMDIFDIIMKIKDEFNIDFPNAEAATLVTVNDLCNYLRDKITAALEDGQYYEFSNWVYELERQKGGNYLEVVNSSTFKAEHPSTLSPSEFVDRLTVKLGKRLTETERAQFIAELSANNTVAGRASILRKIDMKDS